MVWEGTTEAFERLVAPIAGAAVEIGIVVYVAEDGHLAAVRHVHGHREGVDLPLRAIVADALATGSRTVIVAHNHPSGCARESRDDVAMTRRLSRALATIEVRLLDHLILTPGAWVSLRRKGVAV